MSNVVECDGGCGRRLSDGHLSFRWFELERTSAGFAGATDAGPWHFCSVRCLNAWTGRQEGP